MSKLCTHYEVMSHSVYHGIYLEISIESEMWYRNAFHSRGEAWINSVCSKICSVSSEMFNEMLWSMLVNINERTRGRMRKSILQWRSRGLRTALMKLRL
jgi:hypothetical protein